MNWIGHLQGTIGGFAGLAALAMLVGCEASSEPSPQANTASGTDRSRFEAKENEDISTAGENETAVVDSAAESNEPVSATLPNQSTDDTLIARADSEAEVPAVGLETSDKTGVMPEEDPSKYPGGIIPASPNAQPLPGGPRLLVPERTFRTVGNPPALQVNYDDLDLLKVLNMEPVPPNAVEQFPEWLRELDGKRIRLRGFMYPAFEQMLSAFILTRDTGVCCFGPNPKIYYLIGVKLKEGTQARYVENRPIDVVGTFHIEPIVDDDGNWFQLYKLRDAVVVD